MLTGKGCRRLYELVKKVLKLCKLISHSEQSSHTERFPFSLCRGRADVLSTILDSFHRNLQRFDRQRTLLTTHPEVRKDCLGDGVLEGVDVCVVMRVVEWHPALVTVQLHPDPLRVPLQAEPCQRRCTCKVHLVVKVHTQVAVLQHWGHFLFPLHGCFRHANNPRRVIPHADVPCTSACRQCFATRAPQF